MQWSQNTQSPYMNNTKKSHFSRLCSNAPSHWLTSYIKISQLILDIYKMSGQILKRQFSVSGLPVSKYTFLISSQKVDFSDFVSLLIFPSKFPFLLEMVLPIITRFCSGRKSKYLLCNVWVVADWDVMRRGTENTSMEKPSRSDTIFVFRCQLLVDYWLGFWKLESLK